MQSTAQKKCKNVFQAEWLVSAFYFWYVSKVTDGKSELWYCGTQIHLDTYEIYLVKLGYYLPESVFYYR